MSQCSCARSLHLFPSPYIDSILPTLTSDSRFRCAGCAISTTLVSFCTKKPCTLSVAVWSARHTTLCAVLRGLPFPFWTTGSRGQWTLGKGQRCQSGRAISVHFIATNKHAEVRDIFFFFQFIGLVRHEICSPLLGCTLYSHILKSKSNARFEISIITAELATHFRTIISVCRCRVLFS